MNITIDGKICACEPGELLLGVAARNGITIPTLCHHEGLAGLGCCRVCIVEVETRGRRSVVTACVYPVERECAVFTASERIVRERGMILSLLRARAPDSGELANLCEEYPTPAEERFTTGAGERCVLCGICAKACESLGTGAISTVNRGVEKAVSTPYDEPSADCVGCMSCANVCPTGAIPVSENGLTRTIWNRTFALVSCSRCGKPIGTREELTFAAEKAGADPPALCESCRRVTMTDVLALTYGV